MCTAVDSLTTVIDESECISRCVQGENILVIDGVIRIGDDKLAVVQRDGGCSDDRITDHSQSPSPGDVHIQATGIITSGR